FFSAAGDPASPPRASQLAQPSSHSQLAPSASASPPSHAPPATLNSPPPSPTTPLPPMQLQPKTAATLRHIGLLLLRVVAGGFMLWRHGIPKIGRLFSDPIEFADPIGLGVVPSLSL